MNCYYCGGEEASVSVSIKDFGQGQTVTRFYCKSCFDSLIYLNDPVYHLWDGVKKPEVEEERK